MNVTHLVAGNLNGGAAKGAYILHKGLLNLNQGIQSKILTNSRVTFNDPTIVTINNSKIDWIKVAIRGKIDNLPTRLYRNKEKTIFSTGIFGYDFTKHELYQKADIIHLHWINDGFVNMKHLNHVKKPIVWTVRDMWPFTGGCHYSMGCNRYTTGCGQCPQLGSSYENDLSKYVWKRKSKYIPENITAVGISPWISEKLNESKLFNNKAVKSIFNNIDCDEFFPVDRDFSKKALKIDTNKKLILVGAQNPGDYYKGFNKFIDSLKSLDPHKVHLIFFGNLNQNIVEKLNFEYSSFGFLNDSISLRLLYSAADVFVAPSLMEAFGKTIAESMACGTPVVAFNATGPKYMIDHKKTGYLAEPYNPTDLAKGIEWILNDADNILLAKSARNKALKNYDVSIIASKYIRLYESIIKKANK
ncbi:MAG: glucosyltransferase [Balneola sp.]|nr:glucosyltransferase [Balneola sp.]MBE80540.1 glucosyltransferase [Balneola sp.]